MDPSAFATALAHLFSVGGIPLATLGFILWSWSQDRSREFDNSKGKGDDHDEDFIRETNDRLVKLETRQDILWEGRFIGSPSGSKRKNEQ